MGGQTLIKFSIESPIRVFKIYIKSVLFYKDISYKDPHSSANAISLIFFVAWFW
jgi:hypothetical protein